MFDVILNRGKTEHALKYETRLSVFYLIILTTLKMNIKKQNFLWWQLVRWDGLPRGIFYCTILFKHELSFPCTLGARIRYYFYYYYYYYYYYYIIIILLLLLLYYYIILLYYIIIYYYILLL